jgi:hypothetical protein
MSYFKKLAVLLCTYLLNLPLTQADIVIDTQFSEPAKMCFSQTSLRAEPNKFNSIMLDHYLIVSKEHHFKRGLVFVGFRLKSQPDALWLFDGTNWVKRSDFDSLTAFIPNEYNRLPTGQLQPVMPTFVSSYPIDVSSYVGDGELWVGYGLSSETRTSQESFDEMMSNGRSRLIWEIGNPQVATAGDLVFSNMICLSITEMTEIIPLVTTQ